MRKGALNRQLYHAIPGEVHYMRLSGDTPLDKHAYERAIEEAIQTGTERIVIGDMDLAGASLVMELKESYQDRIEILFGFIVKYFVFFELEYDAYLTAPGVDLMILLGENYGTSRILDSAELTNLVSGIETGYFDMILSPDEIFKDCDTDSRETIDSIKTLIWKAAWNGVYLEKGDKVYSPGFWKLLSKRSWLVECNTREIEGL